MSIDSNYEDNLDDIIDDEENRSFDSDDDLGALDDFELDDDLEDLDDEDVNDEKDGEEEDELEEEEQQ